MQIVIDASSILAVLLDEPQRADLIGMTERSTLVSPGSTPWEVGNALVAGWRKRRLSEPQVLAAWASFQQVPLRLIDVDMARALRLALAHGLYVYDAYLLEAALARRVPLLTLDRKLTTAAEEAGAPLMEVPS
jgi:predicted nucleic acid-binding protein